MKELKVELLCRGAKVSREAWDYYKRSAGFPVKIEGKTLVSVPSLGKYNRYSFIENSPFEIRKEEKWWLYRNGKREVELQVADVPSFYSQRTSDGVEMRKVFQVCGWDCLLTGVVQSCAYQKTNTECRFCGTIYNPVYEGRLNRKTPQQLAEVARAGEKEGMKHIVITSGVMPGKDRGARLLLEAAKKIKEMSNLPIQAELAPPEDLKFLEELLEYVDSVSINVETLNQEVREKACPDKSKIPYDQYFAAWKLSLDVLGENQVNSWYIAGIGESKESIKNNLERLASHGVFPFLVPLRPTKGTGFENLPSPEPEMMMELSTAAAEAVDNYGLKPEKNKAGCLRCSACSAVRDYAGR